MSQDIQIVRAAIFPSIGVARLGNSDEFFVGPETYPIPPRPEGFYRDGQGALKRQAARFRIYGYNAAGEVVRELTSSDADITWSVHVANHKAAWYEWVLALDIPEASSTECPRRNADVTDRASLAIDAGEVSISGRDQSGPEFVCRGKFQDTDVELGSLVTDGDGRLVFVPADGTSASPNGDPIFPKRPNAFINANGWYDDVCDGPVSASIQVDGADVPCESAWVLSAPPDYAPNVVSARTLYDLLRALFVDKGDLPFPGTVYFYRDVYPTLHRLTGLGWVNKGFEVQFGLAGPYPFEDPSFVARLADKDPVNDELRRQVLNCFRVPQKPSPDQLPWPWVYGDAMDVPAGDSPRQNATISEVQYRILQEWAAGRYELDTPPSPADELDALAVAEQPDMLTRAALEYCLADAFHPGCEVTWPIRHLSMWSAPFRLKQAPAGTAEKDYGPVMNQEIALSADGPLYAQGPGGLTRWMGLPWQADTAYCRSGYDQDYDPYVPTFWPATVPNQVLTPKIYNDIMSAPDPAARFRAFSQRFAWVAPLAVNPADPGTPASTAEQMTHMVEHFGSMGCLEVRPGPTADPAVPSRLMVATFGPNLPHAADADAAEIPAGRVAAKAAPAPDASPKARPRLAARPPADTGWTSHDEATRAPLPVKLGPKED